MKRLFNSYSLSAIRVVSSAYLRLLIFLPAILIPACASSNQAFCMMYSAYKLNRQSDNIQPWHSPFLIWNQSVVPCPVQTVASGGRSGGLVFPSLEEFPTVLGDPHSQRLWLMLSKSLIQFSVDGQGCVPSLLFDLRPNNGGGNEENGNLLPKVPLMHCCTQCPWPCSRPQPTHASIGDSWTLTGRSGSVSFGVPAPFSRVLVRTRFCLCPPRVCFPSPVEVL